jgi:predicted Zn-dependent protease
MGLARSLVRLASERHAPSDAPELDEALSLARSAVQADPDSARAHAVLAMVLFNRGERDEALHEVADAVRRAPADPSIRCDHAAILAAVRSYRDAEEELRRAIKIDPASADAYQQLGALLGRTDAAAGARCLRRAALLRSGGRE